MKVAALFNAHFLLIDFIVDDIFPWLLPKYNIKL